MAILTGKVYNKIVLDNFSIIGGKVVISVDYYKTQKDREKEKENEKPISTFIFNARNYIDNLQNEFYKLLEENNIDPKIDINEAEFNEILKGNEEIAEKFNNGVSYGIDYDILQQVLILKSKSKVSLKHLDKWHELGLQDEWLEDSVSKIGNMEIELCEYTGQNLTPEYLYTTLKTKFENAVDC